MATPNQSPKCPHKLTSRNSKIVPGIMCDRCWKREAMIEDHADGGHDHTTVRGCPSCRKRNRTRTRPRG